jgi:oxidase EvaA
LGFVPADRLALEARVEVLVDWSATGPLRETVQWYESLSEANHVTVESIPLSQCRQWVIGDDRIFHESGAFFFIEGVRVGIGSDREVGRQGWDQPFLTQVGYDGGILGLVRKNICGVPHYLIETKFEPGNYNKWQISPTLQATFSNIERAHKGRMPRFSELFLEPERFDMDVLREQWLSEDGGRLFNKRNKGMLLQAPDETEHFSSLPDAFRWVSLWQLKELIREKNAMVGPHIRSILSLI